MDYRGLGSTGLKISRLGLGCGNFGGIGSAPAFYGMGETEAQAAELLDRARDAGINLLDTADAYGGGRSEAFIGNWLKARGAAVRDKLVVSSKCTTPSDPANQRGLSAHILGRSTSPTRPQPIGWISFIEEDPATSIDVRCCARRRDGAGRSSISAQATSRRGAWRWRAA
jgi:hypothetical protein